MLQSFTIKKSKGSPGLETRIRRHCSLRSIVGLRIYLAAGCFLLSGCSLSSNAKEPQPSSRLLGMNRYELTCQHFKSTRCQQRAQQLCISGYRVVGSRSAEVEITQGEADERLAFESNNDGRQDLLGSPYFLAKSGRGTVYELECFNTPSPSAL